MALSDGSIRAAALSGGFVLQGAIAAAAFLLVAGCKEGGADPTAEPDRPTTEPEAKVEAEAKETPPAAEKPSPTPEAPAAKAPTGEAKAGAVVVPEAAKAKAADQAHAQPEKKPSAPAAAPEPPPAPAPEPAPTVAAAPAPTPEPPPPPPVVSPKVGEQSFSLWMQSSGRYKAGQQGFVEVVLVPKGDFHCNQEYPYKMKLGAPSDGITYPTPIVRTEGVSVSASRAVMRVPFVPQNPGDVVVAGKFYFSVCTSEQCVIDNRDVAVTVKVDGSASTVPTASPP